MQSIPVRCSKHYLDWTTTTLICCSQRRLSDGEFVKELIYTNCTVSCGKVKYCSSLLDANTMVHYAVRRICLNKKSKVQMGAAGSDIDGSLWSLDFCAVFGRFMWEWGKRNTRRNLFKVKNRILASVTLKSVLKEAKQYRYRLAHMKLSARFVFQLVVASPSPPDLNVWYTVYSYRV